MNKTLLIFLLFVAITPAEAIVTIDQISPISNTVSIDMNSPIYTSQQGITAGASGQLVGVDLWSHGDDLGSFNFFVNIGTPWQTDTNDFSTMYTFTTPNGWNFIDISSANINLIDGELFTIGFQGTNQGGFTRANEGLYSGGELLINEGSTGFSGIDLAFRTYVNTNVVPEPATMVLFGSGVFGVFMRRRLKP